MKARVSHGGADELSPHAEILCCMLVCTTDECTHHTCKETTGQHDDEVMTDDEPLTPIYVYTHMPWSVTTGGKDMCDD